MSDVDAIVIGAGHNGLTAGTMLARDGQKVLVLEKTNWAGGMAATKELFKGYKHSVGPAGGGEIRLRDHCSGDLVLRVRRARGQVFHRL
ncbi:MAG: NAD(P)-binding protein [Deltaproteobacteria bacterium]|nr:NAD(P)-binding protein [Deltaproteobacteria bacterium]